MPTGPSHNQETFEVMLSASNIYKMYNKEMKEFAASSFDFRAFHEFRIDNDTFQRGYWVKFDPVEASSNKYLNQLDWGGRCEGFEILSPVMFTETVVWTLLAVVKNP